MSLLSENPILSKEKLERFFNLSKLKNLFLEYFEDIEVKDSLTFSHSTFAFDYE
jgi:hypothetical protein